MPDAVVVEGPMAGGHLGYSSEHISNPDYSLDKIAKDVLNETRQYEEIAGKQIPVIAAGGIYTGDDILKYLKMGAAGVQMTTRFVTIDEYDASDEFKKSYINCKKEDITIIESPVGMPGRAIINKFLNDVKSGERKPYKCLYHCIKTCDYKKSPYYISQALINAQRGLMVNGFVFAVANVLRFSLSFRPN